MDLLKSQLARLQEQLGELTASQRMLAGALVVIMLMTLFWWSNLAARSEMETLLDNTTLSDDDVTGIGRQLDGRGIRYEVVGGRIRVAASEKYKALAELASAQLLPKDLTNVFDELMKRSGPFDSKSKQDRLWNIARQQWLTSVFREMRGVRSAAVIIDTDQKQTFGQTRPTAAVQLTLKNPEGATPVGNARLARSVAMIVAGAVAGLPPHEVRVTVDGQWYPIANADEHLAGGGTFTEEYLNFKARADQYYKTKIDQHFRFIEGVVVTVTVEPNFKKIEKTIHEIDPKNVVQKEVSSDTTTEEANSAQTGPVEPGIVSNAPLAMADASTAGDNTSTTSEKNRIQYLVDHGRIDIKTLDPGGNTTLMGASVMLPRSYFVKTFKHNKRLSEGQEPDETVLDAWIASQVSDFKQGVQAALNIAPQVIHVGSYTDLLPAMGDVPQIAAAAPMTLLLTAHVKEISLGVLALASLFMVSTMVKRGAAAPVTASHHVSTKPAPLGPPDEVAGEVRETGPLLDGMELDEDSVKAQQMLNQVSNLVAENPDAAANLVKRWLNRS